MSQIQHPLIRPGALEARQYQLAIAMRALEGNTMVVLPTGLGKTAVALLVAASRLKEPGSRVLMLAPTKPLAEQHFQYFSNPLLNFFFINLAQTQRKGHIFKNIHMRKQCIGLKNRVDVSFISWNIIDADAIKKNIPVRRVQKSSNDVQNR